MPPKFDIVIIGLTVTSSWGNGHATTYRGLLRGLSLRGHRVLFLEHDVPWYAENRDDSHPYGAVTELYRTAEDLVARFEQQVVAARLVIVGSFVNDGARIGRWVNAVARGITAFYDIDTPITIAGLACGVLAYLTPELVRQYDLYLSFTGGPILVELETKYGSPMARPLYCCADPDNYKPADHSLRWDLGYLGTFSPDRQEALEELLLKPARRSSERRFAVAGAMYPEMDWPTNVDRFIHLAPRLHPSFYCSQGFTLNVTRAEMKSRGYSPSVRLFEAALCGVPVISDWWEGLDQFFDAGREVLIAHSAEDTLRYLRDYSAARRAEMGHRIRLRVLEDHTPVHRAETLETYLKEIDDNSASGPPRRDGCRRQVDRGIDPGIDLECVGEVSGEALVGEPVAIPYSSRLQQSAGTNNGDGGDAGAAPWARGPTRE